MASCLVFLVRVCSFSEYSRVKTFSVGKDAIKCRVKICPAQADLKFVSYQVIFQIFTSQHSQAFTVWLSENEVTKDERKEIADIFDFAFEELMTSVRDSGLYPASKIDQRVLEIVKEKDLKIKDQDLKIKQLESQS